MLMDGSSESDAESFGSGSDAESPESPDDITFSSLNARPLCPTASSKNGDDEPVAGIVSAPDLALSAPASGFNDDFEAAQSERQYVQKQSQAFLATAVQAATGVDGTLETAYAQAELIECLLHDDIAGVDDYSSYFRENFQLDDSTHPRCYDLLHGNDGSEERAAGGSDAGGEQVEVENWKDITGHFYTSRRRRRGD